ncbi:MAG: nucleoside-diphosphate-sugar epimerase [Sulfurimonas sp.]|jgi:nucleoside-diphosphate-sugar epimerase|uniref:NAD-dependent epimerase/dehydratase family protein n=1 Tax=Sulfurimonas sp. TaxID=2022749 RepID=UPI0039E69E11
MTNILVTGATGFIGSYFIDKYDEKYNIKTFSFVNDDFCSIEFNKINTIIHLSALVHQMFGGSKEEYEKVNVTQTLQLVEKAKENGVKHFIFMSTVKVYGEETEIIYNEKSICTPVDDYGKSKLKSELKLQKLEDENFKISIIRTPIVYGYGVKGNMGNLINLIKKVPILPFAKINNKRSMVNIGNLCHLVDVLIEKKKSGVYLASEDIPLSTTSLIQLISKELNKKVYLLKVPFFENLLKLIKPSLVKRLYGSLEVDNSYTKKDLEFRNLYTIEEGIHYMIHGKNK